jgi:uncharacterized membrane protein YoaK (UPF0700 family)
LTSGRRTTFTSLRWTGLPGRTKAEIDLAAASLAVQTNRGKSVTLVIFVGLILIFLLGVICGVVGTILALHIPIGK